MFTIEGERRWILGLGGVDGDSASTDLEEVLDYARTLRTLTAFDAVRHAELQGGLTRFAFPKSFLRHFEKVLADPWSVAAQDHIHEHLANERPPGFGEKLRFQSALTRLAAEDFAVHQVMTDVAQLLKPSSGSRWPWRKEGGPSRVGMQDRREVEPAR